MAKINVKVNGKETTVEYAKARTGGTLLMSSRFHKSKKAYDRKPKHPLRDA